MTERNIMPVLVALMAAVAVLVISPSTAGAADASACNNIDLSAEANCSALVETECTAQCEPVSFVLACDGQCSGTCNETATTECTQTCSSWCNTECAVDPGSFSCQGGCVSNCETSCPGKCHDHPDQGKCEASCRTSCDTECTASCTVVAPTATCETKCGTCCDTSCTVQHNVECEVACDIQCSASLEGSCEIRCQDPEGAIFCDGQFVDAGDNLQECIEYLESIGNQVDVSAWGSAEAEVGFACAFMPVRSDASSDTTAALAGFALLLFVVFRRRFRQ